VILHGLALSVITIFAILAGYAAYVALGLSEQVAIQVLVAGVLCVAAFALWSFVIHRLSCGKLSLRGLGELGLALVAALVWTPVLFVPLHLVTQGYLTSFGNILSTWLFQVPFNLLALVVANGRPVIEAADAGGR
jgi:hypothetical protein